MYILKLMNFFFLFRLFLNIKKYFFKIYSKINKNIDNYGKNLSSICDTFQPTAICIYL